MRVAYEQWRHQRGVPRPEGVAKLKRKDAGITVDHVIPLSKGGLWSLSNLVTCCKDCNCAKADKLVNKHPLDIIKKT